MPKKYKISGEVEINENGEGSLVAKLSPTEIPTPPDPDPTPEPTPMEVALKKTREFLSRNLDRELNKLRQPILDSVKADRNALYNTYPADAMHSIWKYSTDAVGRRAVAELFQTYIEGWISLTKRLPSSADSTGGGGWPANSKAPWVGYGARPNHDYLQFEFTRPPNSKHLRHLATFSTPFLLDLSVEQEVSPWALDTLQVMRDLVYERLFTTYGVYNRGVEDMVRWAKKRPADHQWPAYWGSQCILAVHSLFLDKLVCRRLDTDPSYAKFIPPEFYKEALGAWIDGMQMQETPNGEMVLWDCDNPRINTNQGWSYPGDHKAPSVSHSNRHANFVRHLKSFGEETYSLEGTMANTFDHAITLPEDYEYQKGRWKGEKAGTVQFSNYLDGDNSNFRLGYAGGYRTEDPPHGTNESMASHIYYGWGQLAAPRSAKALTNCLNLAKQVFAEDDKGEYWGLPQRTGTYLRHKSIYGKMGLLGILCEAVALNRKPT